ncbi:ice-binding family protein [Sphaerisporangium corydalis]|uniref:Ice-binding family protein n=1 Tax=Sphaerisporangium corydalis TaxID=1441875 RepID=A0ABV9EUG0_9ACTN|nr:ice-binding family protein [Sphaerisporangium corydalis]
MKYPGLAFIGSRNIARPWAAALAAVVAAAVVVATPHAAGAAQAPVGLGTATSYAVLAGSAVTNTGPSVVTGDLGVSPGSSVTGFPPGTVIGTVHAADAAAVQAQVDLTTAYNDAAGRTPVTSVPTELGGTTLTPGVYTSAAGTLGITGNLTLDAQGDPQAVFIFQAASTLITASASTVTLIGGAQACNVFWQVGSSATLGTASGFVGTILALTSITATTGATVNGRLLARNGAVTLDSNTITRSDCAPPPVRTTTTTLATSDASVPVGTPVTFTATVTSTAGPVPTGGVRFTADTTTDLGTVQLDSAGHAAATIANLAPGTHAIVATYLGSISLDTSASAPLTQVITAIVPPIPPTPPVPPVPPVPGGRGGSGQAGSGQGNAQVNAADHVRVRRDSVRDHRGRHHRKGRLITIRTLHTIEGVIGENRRGGHHSTTRSRAANHPPHHRAHHKPPKPPHAHTRIWRHRPPIWRHRPPGK